MKENPFSKPILESVYEKEAAFVVPDENGEVLGEFSPYGRVRKKNRTRFSKITQNEIFLQLGSPALHVFMYITVYLIKNQNWVSLPWQDVVEKKGICKSMFYEGVDQLEKLGIIAKRGRGEYWVNTKLAMNGQDDNKKGPEP